MSEDYSKLDYFWVPVDWQVALFLLEQYREDWEGITPSGINLDGWYQILKEASEKHSRVHFPHMHSQEKGEF
jgi:hypothetical protein